MGGGNDDEDEIKIYRFLCSETRMFPLRGSVQTDETFLKCFLSEELVRESMMILIELIFGHQFL